MTYTVRLTCASHRRKIMGPFKTFAECSEAYSSFRDSTGEGASTFGDGQIFDANGFPTHRISYNGRVWKELPREWQPGDEPVYDPRKAGAAQ